MATKKAAKVISMKETPEKGKKEKRFYADINVGVGLKDLETATNVMLEGGPKTALQVTAAFLSICRQIQRAREGHQPSIDWMNEFWRDPHSKLNVPDEPNKKKEKRW